MSFYLINPVSNILPISNVRKLKMVTSERVQMIDDIENQARVVLCILIGEL